jgi:putative transposase
VCHQGPVLDPIVGYSIGARMPAELAVAALRNAVALRDPAGTTVHSDRGSQFRSNAFVAALKHYELVGSMGRVGACGDNAAMESFFAVRLTIGAYAVGVVFCRSRSYGV